MFPFQFSNELENANCNINSDNYVNMLPYASTAVLDKIVPVTSHLHLQPQPQPVMSSGKIRGRPRTEPTRVQVTSENDASRKKIVHREIERQRRQEMSSLYTSLRSLLPLESIRGKRSMCDHIAEATKYIKDMEKKITELRDTKEKLKSSSNSSIMTTNFSSCSSTSTCDYNVNIHTSSGETEIEISARVEEEEEDRVFPISKVLHVLIQEGLNVVDCVSSKVNQRWIYILHCEVFDKVSIDSNELQRRLMGEIGSSYR